MTYDSVGEVDLRGENVSRAVKGYGDILYKLKQVCTIETSKQLTETYFKEAQAALTAGGNRNVNQIARGALFPELIPTWEKTSGDHVKFGGQAVIFFEDGFDAINVQKRTYFKVAQAVASAVDSYIYAQLTAATSTSGVVAASATWNNAVESSRDSIGDILIGIAAMEDNSYDVRGNGYLLLNPTDYSSLLRDDRVIKNPSFKTADVVSNGVVGQICSLNIIVSVNVTATEAMIVHKKAATWKSAAPLTTYVRVEPGINVLIRAWEFAQIQITDPYGLYTITGTA